MQGKPATPASRRNFQLGPWRVEPDLDQLSNANGIVALTPKAMAVLVYLAERQGHVVSTEELVDVIWHGRPMGDNPVYKCITQLRTVLGDDRKDPRFIATVHTKGYRLTEAVVWDDPDADRTDVKTAALRKRKHLPVWVAGIAILGLLATVYFGARDTDDATAGKPAVSTVAEKPSIAVLPFANMSPGPGQDYFADGLTEELITQLAKLPGVRVIGRTSSFAFKGKDEDLRTIGQILGVNHILEGSIRKTNDRVRVTAQLINPADGSHYWAESYDRNADDIFTIQEEIAKTVASALRVSIAARIVTHGGTRNFEAYDAFLAGLAAAAKGGADNVTSSIASFQRAVSADPRFTAAWEELADAYQLASIDIPQRRLEWLAKLAETEDRLQQLDPSSPRVTLQEARREMASGNLFDAERLFKSLREQAPNYSAGLESHGIFLLNVGRPRDAIPLFLRDQEAEPLALSPSLWLQIAYELAEDPLRAETEFQRALGFAEDTRAIRTMALIRALEKGDIENIKHHLATQTAIAPLTRPLNQSMLQNLADPPLARALLHQQLTDPASANSNIIVMMIAAWAAYFDDPELALMASERLPPLANNTFNWTIWRPLQRDMRSLPGFKTLLRDWGLVDYWRDSGSWGDYCRPLQTDEFTCQADSVAK